ncbi:GNAT family N-acetyltransferase [Streptomyces sp. NPDC005917]|uniref:GNAT family N-acetyltransferase n=1 Tax=unclassified Streptomyces TaxID=2593676 RepID=UPI0033C9A7B7
MAMSLFIAKVHGLAVAEHARGQGIAAALLKRTWQVYEQLGCTAPTKPTAITAPSTPGAATPSTSPASASPSTASPSPSGSAPATTSACSPAGAPSLTEQRTTAEDPGDAITGVLRCKPAPELGRSRLALFFPRELLGPHDPREFAKTEGFSAGTRGSGALMSGGGPVGSW